MSFSFLNCEQRNSTGRTPSTLLPSGTKAGLHCEYDHKPLLPALGTVARRQRLQEQLDMTEERGFLLSFLALTGDWRSSTIIVTLLLHRLYRSSATITAQVVQQR
jgi:hypothetical protein